VVATTDFIGYWADMAAFMLEIDVNAHFVFGGGVVLQVGASEIADVE